MNEIKNKRIREQRIVVTSILLISGVLLLILGFLIKEQNLRWCFLLVGAALFIGIFLVRIFDGKFGYKPTLEEIEEEQFGKK